MLNYEEFMEKAVDMVITVYNELYSDGYLLSSEDIVCSWCVNESLFKKCVFYTVLDNELLYEVTFNYDMDKLCLNVYRKLTYKEYDL